MLNQVEIRATRWRESTKAQENWDSTGTRRCCYPFGILQVNYPVSDYFPKLGINNNLFGFVLVIGLSRECFVSGHNEAASRQPLND